MNKKWIFILVSLAVAGLLLVTMSYTAGRETPSGSSSGGDTDIETAKDELSAELLVIEDIVGVGIGECDGKPCILVYLEYDSPDLREKVPAEFKGFKVAVEVTGLITAPPYPAEPDIRGIITTIQKAEGNGWIGSILVENSEGTQYDKAMVIITAATNIRDERNPSNIRRVTFESLEIGQRVEVRFIGPVAESYPVQATAMEILILAKK